MKQRFSAFIFLTAVLLVFTFADFSQGAYTIGGVDYIRQGSTETLTAVFTQVDGGVTTNTYSGLVELIVSGTGESSATRLNDAFYVFTDGAHVPVAPFNSGNYYQLAVSTQTLVPFQPQFEAKRSVVFDVAANVEVSPIYVPAYNANHTYNVVIDLSNVNLNQLHFGVSNGNFSDNSGAYSIEVFQLAPNVIPAPGAFILGSIGMGFAGWLRRRKSL